MRLTRNLGILARGTALSAAAAAAAFLIARYGFRRDYYAAVLLPVFMAASALVAWFLYLRDDGLVRGSPENRRQGRAAPPDRAPIGLSLFAPRDGGLVERAASPAFPRGYPRPEGEAARELRGVFLCAAVELGLLATALYFFEGLGASFFL